MGRRKGNDLERFWSKVDRSGGPDACWTWTGARVRGYGQFGLTRGFQVRAHRHSFMLANGDIPDGMCILHACNNPACVNPAHLSVGTQLENMQYAGQCGRTRNKPLAPEVVIEIKGLINVGWRNREIAAELAVSKQIVSNIRHGHRHQEAQLTKRATPHPAKDFVSPVN